ncbi:MAG: hypothetical protein EZS28_004593 [Streblomastix strix]|uniref:Uncharacterized protein n=1 Tax=Streblomastix strix TaxID=222440 RepID=A0A5J4WZC9_9EUKA|nr:MAG: hypothetical protein EZS28_004593 [Streblomastix strix]
MYQSQLPEADSDISPKVALYLGIYQKSETEPYLFDVLDISLLIGEGDDYINGAIPGAQRVNIYDIEVIDAKGSPMKADNNEGRYGDEEGNLGRLGGFNRNG